jgi:hypothetical protein
VSLNEFCNEIDRRSKIRFLDSDNAGRSAIASLGDPWKEIAASRIGNRLVALQELGGYEHFTTYRAAATLCSPYPQTANGRTTPAMADGVTDQLWEVSNIRQTGG